MKYSVISLVVLFSSAFIDNSLHSIAAVGVSFLFAVVWLFSNIATGVLVMFRIKKVLGWNKYKVQKRFMFLFWRDAEPGKDYCGKGIALARAVKLASDDDSLVSL